MKGRRWLTATAAAGALALTGCISTAANQSASTSGQPAPALATSARIPATGILVGTNPADRSLHTAWTADAWQVARAAGQSSARVVIDRFGTGPESSDVMFNALLASSDGQNSLIRQTQVKHAEDQMVGAFDAGQAAVLPGPIDLISGIQAMEAHLREQNAVNPDVIVFGDAEQTVGSVNLTDPLQLADPIQTPGKVKAQGLLQANDCRGWNVYMVNPSPAGFTALQDEQLREFWREFFADCGGHLILWDNTLIFPASGQVPRASWASPGDREIIIPLPASVLFKPEQAILLPGATRVFGDLCRDLTSAYPTATAEIAGYTAAVGGGDGMALSQARAQVVATYLEECGISASRLSAHGYGDREQIPGGLAANRRVVITLHVR
jgi:outer membrane protein OmpA-like peptidoglycan-associated protein